jgi:electron transport complex protein RnfE
MGVGFTLALMLLGGIREILGSNTLYGYEFIPGFKPALIMILPPGAFLTIGLLLGLFALIRSRREMREKRNSEIKPGKSPSIIAG